MDGRDKNESLGIEVEWFIKLTELPWEYLLLYYFLKEGSCDDVQGAYRRMFDDDAHELVHCHHHVTHLVHGNDAFIDISQI